MKTRDLMVVVGCSVAMTAGCSSGQQNSPRTVAVPATLQAPATAPHDRPGFVTDMDQDGRLWVFRAGSPELESYLTEGKPARHVVRPAAGPLGLTLKAVDSEIILEYVAVREGFFTELDQDGRLWVFRAGSPELESYLTEGKPARHVVRPAAGPLGLTLKAVDVETLDAYQAVR